MLHKLSEQKCFDGIQYRLKHFSEVLNCEMTFSVFLPSQSKNVRVPVLYWLSGLTCTDENFVQKAGAQQFAQKHGVAIVCADTSPRGDDVPDDNGSYDFGKGAGFYLNATQEPWKKHYQMYDYIVSELPEVIATNFPINIKLASIFGHSMGGHGALMIALKNHTKYCSVSAFAPISSASQCPWGIKALSRYLGDNQNAWLAYDVCELAKTCKTNIPILIDQGSSDQFLNEQLKPERLLDATKNVDLAIILRMQEGYDHSYFFISSFMKDHIEFHAKHLKQIGKQKVK